MCETMHAYIKVTLSRVYYMTIMLIMLIPIVVDSLHRLVGQIENLPTFGVGWCWYGVNIS